MRVSSSYRLLICTVNKTRDSVFHIVSECTAHNSFGWASTLMRENTRSHRAYRRGSPRCGRTETWLQLRPKDLKVWFMEQVFQLTRWTVSRGKNHHIDRYRCNTLSYTSVFPLRASAAFVSFTNEWLMSVWRWRLTGLQGFETSLLQKRPVRHRCCELCSPNRPPLPPRNDFCAANGKRSFQTVQWRRTGGVADALSWEPWESVFCLYIFIPVRSCV